MYICWVALRRDLNGDNRLLARVSKIILDLHAAMNQNDCAPAWQAGSQELFPATTYDEENNRHRPVSGQ